MQNFWERGLLGVGGGRVGGKHGVFWEMCKWIILGKSGFGSLELEFTWNGTIVHHDQSRFISLGLRLLAIKCKLQSCSLLSQHTVSPHVR